MLPKTLTISFYLLAFITFIIGSYTTADDFLIYRGEANQALLAHESLLVNSAFWTIVLDIILLTFLITVFFRLSDLFKNFSNKEYFSKESIKLLKLTGSYLVLIQLVIYITVFSTEHREESVTISSLPDTMSSVFHYSKLMFRHGAFMLVGAGLIAMSIAFKRGHVLEAYEKLNN